MADVDCEHGTIQTFRFSDPEHESFGHVAMWACADCRRRFEPTRVDVLNVLRDVNDWLDEHFPGSDVQKEVAAAIGRGQTT